MILNPKNIEFENIDDLIDYVSKGLKPRKKYYLELREKIRNPNDSDTNISNHIGNEIYINKDLFVKIDNEDLLEIMDRVYNNRVYNLVVAYLVLVAIGFALSFVIFNK